MVQWDKNGMPVEGTYSAADFTRQAMATAFLKQNSGNGALGKLLNRNSAASKALGAPQFHTPKKLSVPSMSVHTDSAGLATTTKTPVETNALLQAKNQQNVMIARQHFDKKRTEWTSSTIGNTLKQLQDKGLTEDEARQALARELVLARTPQQQKMPTLDPAHPNQWARQTITAMNENTKAKKDFAKNKNVDMSQTFNDPLMGKQVVKRLTADPFLTMKNTKDPKKAVGQLAAASFLRTPQGTQAAQAKDPFLQAQAVQQGYSQQVMDRFNYYTAPGGLADQFDAYKTSLRQAEGMTAKQISAAFGVESISDFKDAYDPLNKLGFTENTFRKYLFLQEGDALSGAAIRGAMVQNLDAERASIKAGRPMPGSHLGDFLNGITSNTPGITEGKAMVNAFQNLAGSLPKEFQDPRLQNPFGLAVAESSGLLDPTTVALNSGKPSSNSLAVPGALTNKPGAKSTQPAA